MHDALSSIALRGESPESLAIALGRCFADYGSWHGHAMIVSGFAQDAHAANVKQVLQIRMHEALEICKAEGIVNIPSLSVDPTEEFASNFANHQFSLADQGIKVAAIVMLHNACERFLWRLIRFGLIGNRKEAIKCIGKRKVSVETLANCDLASVIDSHLEEWWTRLERDPIKKKWDCLCSLFGFPEKLKDPPWNFDREMLESFDSIRNNAVHHDAQDIQSFDLEVFSGQLYRAQLVWFTHVAKYLQITVPAEVAIMGRWIEQRRE